MDTISAAKLIAIPSAFLLSGYYTSASQNSLPLLYKQPASISTPFFTGVYNRGFAVAVPLTLISTTAFSFLAYSLPAQRTMYAGTAGVVFSALPFTVAAMLPGINRLMEIGKGGALVQEKAERSGEVTRLLKAWAAQNWVRMGMSFAGGIGGLVAAMGV